MDEQFDIITRNVEALSMVTELKVFIEQGYRMLKATLL